MTQLNFTSPPYAGLGLVLDDGEDDGLDDGEELGLEIFVWFLKVQYLWHSY